MSLRSRSRSLRAAAALLLASSLFLAPVPASADSVGDAGLVGAGAALATLVYGPTKLLYAAGGGLVAGLAWIHSGGDGAVVQPILDASLRGDYVITPAHLRRQVPIEFVGRSRANQSLRAQDTGSLQGEELYRDGY